METELKFQVPPARREGLRRAVATASASTTRLQAIYAETAGQHLARAGLALRLRKEGRIWVQTLKGRGDGLIQRLEHEVRLPPQAGVPALDLQRHAGTPVAAALAAALPAGADLLPLYRTDIRRLHRRVRSGGATIEIAYDCGQLIAGDRRLPVDEIEFELISGPPAALAALARRWAARHGLWWDSRTKSERGLRLALGVDRVPATKSRAPAWPVDATPDALWRSALQAALVQALPNAAEIAEGLGSPEHLHQLRVALRRLRSVLRDLAPWGGQETAALALEAAWRAPFNQLGAVRDADVQASSLRPRLQAAGAPDFDWPTGGGDAMDPAAIVVGTPFTDLLLRSLALALTPVAAVPASPGLRPAADAMLRSAWRRLLKDAAAFSASSTELQHRTRKRLKRFRYTLELLAPLYPVKRTRRLLKAVGAALDALGALNDLRSAEALCRARTASDARAWFAVGWLAAQLGPAQELAARALGRLARAPRVWRAG